LKNTPQALANFSPGLERQRQPWDQHIKSVLTLKGFAFKTNPFRVVRLFVIGNPGLSLRSNPG